MSRGCERPRSNKWCKCADAPYCLKADQGFVFFRGQHKTRKEVLAFILKQPCWKGAKKHVSNGVATLTKGTAVLTLRLTA